LETFAYVVAVFFVLQFLWSYYWNCYRKGYTVDMWHLTLLNLMVPIHLMLPFNRSQLNFFALGGLLPRAEAHITQAYFISVLGYTSVLLGGFLWRVNLGLGTRRKAAAILEIPARGPMLLLSNKGLMQTHGAVALLMLAAVLGFYFRVSGVGFNLRGLLLTYPPLRPIAQFAAFYGVLIGSHCLARFTVFKEWSMLFIPVGVGVALLFYGERATLVGLTFLTVTVAFVKLGRRLKLIWLLLGAPLLLFSVFALNALREPGFNLNNSLARLAMEVLYGNSFSDTRDFALVLSFWNGHYFYGMTYLAGLLAFIPRVLSPFRDKWAIGVVTASMAGFSPTQHSGLRPGSFGEAFLNFGLPGVAALGMLFGVVSRFVDMRTKQAVSQLPPTSLRAYSYQVVFSVIAALEISANASTVSTVLLIFLASWAFLTTTRFLNFQETGA
jgi:hypothetical protein